MIVKTLKDLQIAGETLKNDNIIACDLETSDLEIRTAKLEGIGFGTKDNAFFIPYPNGISNADIYKFLKELFEAKTTIFHNAKYDLEVLLQNKFPTPKAFQDTLIMSWLVDENHQHGLKPLVKEIFGREPRKWKELDRGINLFRDEEDVMEELAEYCCEDVKNTYELYFHFLPLLKQEGVDVAYERVELKLIPVLVSMEMRGIKVDVSWLIERQGEASKELKGLETDISKKIIESIPSLRMINIRSPKQLEEILFNILKYPPLKRTPTGKRSTDNEALEDLVKKFKLKKEDIVPMLLKFRDLDKVYTTYLVALAEQAGLENVVHTNFNQCGTRTGRLSSDEPNLQNIPTREDNWNVRSAFIAREGYKFLIADYSQIELRVLAHFSMDEHMVGTFNKGGDIHKKTMELTGITERRIAKNINFGIIYGQGPRTLATVLKIPEADAKMYIQKFFEGYPQTRRFIERIQQGALKIGYVEMITGRKRHFQEIYDKRWYSEIARQAINTKIQGSAADLMKIAMIKLQPEITKLGAFSLIQVHDELIIETPVDKVEEVKAIIKDVMEHAIVLRVPLTVNIVEGDRWIKG